MNQHMKGAFEKAKGAMKNALGISFRTANGRELSFLMDRQSTERFSETIQSALGRDTTPRGPRPSRN